ncbi:sperm flagellar protein 1-like [Anopheles cruzii]|uniref:sperm flagellar protein 1-like n=1 Tax=Anopheles cruzii TaxID=68878 RepID=UPI0022EC740E|nr:sperm flagellar protein 1-like [Anopheles cruzii]
MAPLSSEELSVLCVWLHQFHLSKSIKHFTRDMSDGVLVAEILKCLFPKLVDLHNYSKCNSTANKLSNWQTLNRKVLRRLNIYLDDAMIMDLVSGSNGIMEILLNELMVRTTRTYA